MRSAFVLLALLTISPAAPAANADRIAQQSVASPYRFPERLQKATIRYRVEREDGAAFSLPDTGSQRVLRRGRAVVIEVCAECGPPPALSELALKDFQQPHGLVDSDHPRVRAFARNVRTRDPDSFMRQASQNVRTLMRQEVRYDTRLSASEALREWRGDCGEYAVLLAALGRARGIPTRVVDGLAYNSRFSSQSHVFAPHVWVEAYIDGRWRAFDAALGKPGALRIALAVGLGEPAEFKADVELRQQLKIAAAGVVPN